MNNDVKKQQFAAFHEQWLRDGTTQEIKKILENHEKTIVDAIANGSMASITDQQIRLLACQLKTTQTIRQLMFNTETLVEKVFQNK